jgi:hypothetical protein
MNEFMGFWYYYSKLFCLNFLTLWFIKKGNTKQEKKFNVPAYSKIFEN